MAWYDLLTPQPGGLFGQRSGAAPRRKAEEVTVSSLSNPSPTLLA